MLTKIQLAITASAAAMLLGIAATALAAETPLVDDATGVPVFRGASTGFEQAVDIKQARDRYAQAFDRAKRFGIEPKVKLGKDADAGQLDRATRSLNQRATAAKKAEEREQAKIAKLRDETVGGLEGTLEAIAACESGGDPTAISPGGLYRGKYQFDMQTWAAVGGSGDPAAASVAEQDYRAALLYQQSGSSPWPVCGR